MNSIEFGKKCRPLNIQYRELFGYVPCREDYICSQEVYFDTLLKSITEGKELSAFLKKKVIDYNDPNKLY